MNLTLLSPVLSGLNVLYSSTWVWSPRMTAPGGQLTVSCHSPRSTSPGSCISPSASQNLSPVVAASSAAESSSDLS